MALVSAHRGGAGDDHSRENTLDAFEAAIVAGCDYVEFDVRVTADGQAVIFHDDELPGHDLPISIARRHLDEIPPGTLVSLDSVLTSIRGRVRAHVDLKVRGHDIAIVTRIVEAMGAENVIITTAEDTSVRKVRKWARQHAPDLLVGLSSSPRAGTTHWLDRRRVQLESAFPRLRIRLSDANLVVSHKLVARISLKAYARRRGLPLLVWTVDQPVELTRWVNDPDVWMVTTNHPARALVARRD